MLKCIAQADPTIEINGAAIEKVDKRFEVEVDAHRRIFETVFHSKHTVYSGHGRTGIQAVVIVIITAAVLKEADMPAAAIIKFKDPGMLNGRMLFIQARYNKASVAHAEYTFQGGSGADKMFDGNTHGQSTKPWPNAGLIILRRPVIRDKEDANKHND
ncbi:MAG: hypothetical protein JWQ78_1088 [Sediminibacterium sp.]|nr:hypothetical protein [Sediminibacterium sp.]